MYACMHSHTQATLTFAVKYTTFGICLWDWWFLFWNKCNHFWIKNYCLTSIGTKQFSQIIKKIIFYASMMFSEEDGLQ